MIKEMKRKKPGGVQGEKLHHSDFPYYFLELHSTTAALSFVATLVVEAEAAAERNKKHPADEVAFKARSPTPLNVSPERRPIRQAERRESTRSILLVSRRLATQYQSRATAHIQRGYDGRYCRC